MKLFIPAHIQLAIMDAPKGSALLGTFSDSYGVATVTNLLSSSASSASEYSFDSTTAAQQDITRQVLAVIDCNDASYPLRVSRNGAVSWSDNAGRPLDVEVYDTNEFFKRTPFDPIVREHLRRENVLVIGMGSVGAPMSLELAKSGIGGIVAVDKDVLEIHNCMRHCLGTAYVGWSKPTAFAHFLGEQVPDCHCTPVYGDIFQGDRASLHELFERHRPTRILAATDSLRIQYLCQRIALHYQLPLMTVWCDNNAIEGEVFMWEPGQAEAWKPGRPERGCYACMRHPDTVTIGRSSTFDYSSDDPDSYGGEPALGTFINRINNIATIFMTAWMLRDCPVPGKLAGILDEHYEGKGLQYIRLGGPYPFEAEGQVTAKTPWAVEWYRVLKNRDCSFCRDAAANAEILFPQGSIDTESGESWDKFEAI